MQMSGYVDFIQIAAAIAVNTGKKTEPLIRVFTEMESISV